MENEEFSQDPQKEENIDVQIVMENLPGAGGLLKDPDAIKLFIGQIPKEMTEAELRPIFEEFGNIFDLMVIRDKTTGIHRRCAFLTYCNRASAEQAIAVLHGQRKLPGAQNPLQVRAAEGQAERENKLFVGMVPKTADEEALREVFGKYGMIKEVHIIRNQDGTNKGCAFLKFMERQAAFNAIADLNEQFTMEGGPRPLVVKFADNKKNNASDRGRDRDRFRDTNRDGPSASGGGPSMGLYPTTVLDPSGMSGGQMTLQGQYGQGMGLAGTSHSGGSGDMNPGYWPLIQSPYYTLQQTPHLQAVPALGMPYLYGAATAPSAGGAAPSYQVYYSPMLSPTPAPGYLSSQQIANNSPSRMTGVFGRDGLLIPPELGSPPMSPQMGPQMSPQMAPMYGGYPRSYSISSPPRQRQLQLPSDPPQPDGSPSDSIGAQSRSTMEGPPGANLFIYHLPHDLTDADLATAFAPFGNVISAKVYVDKNTGQSKGFGFVSYEQPAAAESAILGMNGFQIGSKRLKVQHKRVPGSFDSVQAPRMQQFQGPYGNQGYQDVSSVLQPAFRSLSLRDM